MEHICYYTSADESGPDAPWSVYRERYASATAAEPIDGSGEWVSTHPSEQAADAEAARLHEPLPTPQPTPTTVEVWTLTVDGDQFIFTMAFGTEHECWDRLREEHAEDFEGDDSALVDYLTTEVGIAFYIDVHTVVLP